MIWRFFIGSGYIDGFDYINIIEVEEMNGEFVNEGSRL